MFFYFLVLSVNIPAVGQIITFSSPFIMKQPELAYNYARGGTENKHHPFLNWLATANHVTVIQHFF